MCTECENCELAINFGIRRYIAHCACVCYVLPNSLVLLAYQKQTDINYSFKRAKTRLYHCVLPKSLIFCWQVHKAYINIDRILSNFVENKLSERVLIYEAGVEGGNSSGTWFIGDGTWFKWNLNFLFGSSVWYVGIQRGRVVSPAPEMSNSPKYDSNWNKNLDAEYQWLGWLRFFWGCRVQIWA